VKTWSGKKWGYIDKSGKIVIEPQFDWALHFTEGLAAVKVKGKYGFLDQTGKMVIQPQYHEARNLSEGLAPVGIADK
jgi:hypothetical protein